MIKELVKDEAVLSPPCEPATAADAEVAQDLVDTLLSIEDAACLAANQIGVTKAIIGANVGYETFAEMIMTTACGTAVRVRRKA